MSAAVKCDACGAVGDLGVPVAVTTERAYVMGGRFYEGLLPEGWRRVLIPGIDTATPEVDFEVCSKECAAAAVMEWGIGMEVAAIPELPEDFDTTNWTTVGVLVASKEVIWHGNRQGARGALVHAAWVVAMAETLDPYLPPFEAILAKVRST